MKRRLVLGTAGHIDHGKTALVRALTGIDTDRLAEEKRRGITIDLGFARLDLDADSRLAIVDVPGHEAFIRNMLAGATGIDIVLLVVAADEGIMPQTREHLAIVELLGVRACVVAITKVDLVDDEWLDLVRDEVAAELARSPFAAAAVVPVSARTGLGLDTLRLTLRDAARSVAGRGDDDLFRLPVDRVFTVHGTGTVVTGTVWSGTARRDLWTRILPADLSARIRGIQAHDVDVPAAAAGQRAAVALAGVDRDQVQRGDVLVLEPCWLPHPMLTARIRLLPATDWTLRSRQRVRFHLGTAEIMARVVLLDGTRELLPGDAAWAQLRLERPAVARAGDRFVIRSYSPSTTIGGGVIAEPAPTKRRRLAPGHAALLDAIIGGEPDAAIKARCTLAGWAGAPVDSLPVQTPLTPDAARLAVQRLEPDAVRIIGEHAFDADIVRQARDALIDAVNAFHRDKPLRPGIDREELRRCLPRHAANGLADAVLAALLDDRSLAATAGTIAAPDFLPRLSADQIQAREQILLAFEHAGLAPPAVAELPDTLRLRHDLWPILKLLERDHRLVALAPELFISRTAIDGAIARVRSQLPANKPLAPTDFKHVLNISRKFLIPILEYFDRVHITTRQGDTRVVNSP